MATTAEKIKLLQKKYRLTSRKMAEIVGKSLPSWNNYISGKTTVTREILNALSEKFNVPFEELVGDEGLQVSKRGRKPKRDLEVQEGAEKKVTDIEATDMEAAEKTSTDMEALEKTEESETAFQKEEAQDNLKRKGSDLQVYFQSSLGSTISYEQLIEKAPEDTASIYVKLEEGKAYWTDKEGSSGVMDLW